jgi:hypothetical protein
MKNYQKLVKDVFPEAVLFCDLHLYHRPTEKFKIATKIASTFKYDIKNNWYYSEDNYFDALVNVRSLSYWSATKYKAWKSAYEYVQIELERKLSE